MHRRMNLASHWATALVIGIGTLGICSQPGLAKENGLVGVRCGKTALSVLRVYGNPTHVSVGGVTASTSTSANPLGEAASAATGIAAGLNAAMGGLEMPGGAIGTATPAMPGLGGAMAGMPGMPGATGIAGAMGAMPGLGMAQTAVSQPSGQGEPSEVVWTYDLPNNNTLQVYVDEDGRIDQVTCSGFNWSKLKTSRGITLGTPYKRVLAKYGYPDKHEDLGGGTLKMISYTQKNNVSFVFEPKKMRVVAIIVSRAS